MTLNGVMVVTMRYFTEVGKPAFQHITASARKKKVHVRYLICWWASC